MATSYHITIGYNGDNKTNAHEALLFEEGTKLRDQPVAIREELERIRKRAATDAEMDCISTFADRTQLAYIQRPSHDEDDRAAVILMASGGLYDAKREVRRAFCRLLVERMHKHGINVNVHVY